MTNQALVTGRGRLPVQPRDRRPALAALALLLVVAGALGSALVAYRSGNRFDVLIVQGDIAPGHKMTAADFGTSRIAGSSAGLVRQADEPAFIGSYATTTIPKGALINARMFTNKAVAPTDSVIVGLQLTPAERPAAALHAGDVVRLFEANTGSSSGSSTAAPGSAASGTVLVSAARIVDVTALSTSVSTTSSTLSVSVLLSSSDATAVMPSSTLTQVAVGLLPLGTTPGIDFLANS